MSEAESSNLVKNEGDGAKRAFAGSRLHLFGVLSFITMFYVGIISSFLINNQYIYYRYATDEGIPGVGLVSGCGANISESLRQRAAKAQQRSAQLELYVALSHSIPSIFSVFIVSALSDRLGRKVSMFIPWCSSLLATTFHTIVIVLDLPVVLFIPATFIGGIGGSYASMLAAIFATTADITSKSYRAMGIGIIEATLVISATIAEAGAGSWVTAAGYKAPTVFFAVLSALSIVPYMALIPETSPTLRHNQPPITLRSFFDIFRNSANLFRSDIKRAKRLAALLASFFFLSIAFLAFGVTNLYLLNLPFCWSSQEIGIFLALDTVVTQVVLVITLFLAKKLFSSSDFSLLSLGLISNIGQLIVFAIASLFPVVGTVLLWSSRVVGLFTKIPAVMLRSMLSKSVGPTEQGSVFGAVAVFQIFAGLFAGTLSASIYQITVSFFSGFVFLVLAGTIVLAFVAGCLHKFLEGPPETTINVDSTLDISEADQTGRS